MCFDGEAYNHAIQLVWLLKYGQGNYDSLNGSFGSLYDLSTCRILVAPNVIGCLSDFSDHRGVAHMLKWMVVIVVRIVA